MACECTSKPKFVTIAKSKPKFSSHALFWRIFPLRNHHMPSCFSTLFILFQISHQTHLTSLLDIAGDLDICWCVCAGSHPAACRPRGRVFSRGNHQVKAWRRQRSFTDRLCRLVQCQRHGKSQVLWRKHTVSIVAHFPRGHFSFSESTVWWLNDNTVTSVNITVPLPWLVQRLVRYCLWLHPVTQLNSDLPSHCERHNDYPGFNRHALSYSIPISMMLLYQAYGQCLPVALPHSGMTLLICCSVSLLSILALTIVLFDCKMQIFQSQVFVLINGLIWFTWILHYWILISFRHSSALGCPQCFQCCNNNNNDNTHANCQCLWCCHHGTAIAWVLWLIALIDLILV